MWYRRGDSDRSGAFGMVAPWWAVGRSIPRLSTPCMVASDGWLSSLVLVAKAPGEVQEIRVASWRIYKRDERKEPYSADATIYEYMSGKGQMVGVRVNERMWCVMLVVRAWTVLAVTAIAAMAVR